MGGVSRRSVLFLVAALVATLTALPAQGTPAIPEQPVPAFLDHGLAPDELPPLSAEPRESDIRMPEIDLENAFVIEGADDPLGLVSYWSWHTNQSLGAQSFGIFFCMKPGQSVSGADWDFTVNAFNDQLGTYFAGISAGAFTPTFVQGGAFTLDFVTADQCINEAERLGDAGDGYDAAVVIALPAGLFGLAGPGCLFSSCAADVNWPTRGRTALIGSDVVAANLLSVTAHEIGHTIHWPHSYSRQSTWQYDNPIDLMSGGPSALGFGDFPGTLAFNRYAAGWLPANQVHVFSGGVDTVTLGSIGHAGTQLIVVGDPTGGEFVVVDARVTNAYDDIPSSYEGVAFHFVDQDDDCGFCVSLSRWQAQYPPVGDSLSHVLGSGQSTVVGDVDVEVVSRSGDTFTVRLTGPELIDPVTGFSDVLDSPFLEEIRWLWEQGITNGCNPPGNDRFCPDNPVTRGQMASFLVRALGLPATAADYFTDDGGLVHEVNINALAEAAITNGCAGTLYCPWDTVIRAQMASFLVRALGLPPSATDYFPDDDGLVHEDNINALAQSGITLGCLGGTAYCPGGIVTREQMAAFLYRGLAGS